MNYDLFYDFINAKTMVVKVDMGIPKKYRSNNSGVMRALNSNKENRSDSSVAILCVDSI